MKEGLKITRFLHQGSIVFIEGRGVKTDTAVLVNLPHKRAAVEHSNLPWEYQAFAASSSYVGEKPKTEYDFCKHINQPPFRAVRRNSLTEILTRRIR